MRRAALVRLFERGLLTASGVGVLLRRHVDDQDANVRAMAFLVSVASQPALAEALRAVDEDLDRRLTELETPEGETSDEAESKDDAKKAAKKPKKAAKKAGKKKSEDSLDDEALRPLLEALASRAADTCLEGAKALDRYREAAARRSGNLVGLRRGRIFHRDG